MDSSRSLLEPISQASAPKEEQKFPSCDLGEWQVGQCYLSVQTGFTWQPPGWMACRGMAGKGIAIRVTGLEWVDSVGLCVMHRERKLLRRKFSLALPGVLWEEATQLCLLGLAGPHFQIQQTFTEYVLRVHPKSKCSYKQYLILKNSTPSL